MHAFSRRHGFTLIEVLVAMVVMAIMSLMAWQASTASSARARATSPRLEQTLRLETVIAQWEQDIAAIQDTSGAVPALSCDGQSVRLTRRTDSGVQVVAWSLRPGDHGATWQRWAGPPVTTTLGLQDSWLRTTQFQGNESGQLRALTGLDEWRVFFFQGNAWANCQSTGNVVTPTSASAPVAGQRQALPGGVRIVLAFAPGSGLAGTLVRDTLVAP